MNNQGFLKPFLHVSVTVDIPVGTFCSVLHTAERSKHGGTGSLLLENPHGWLLIKAWTAKNGESSVHGLGLG